MTSNFLLPHILFHSKRWWSWWWGWVLGLWFTWAPWRDKALLNSCFQAHEACWERLTLASWLCRSSYLTCVIDSISRIKARPCIRSGVLWRKPKCLLSFIYGLQSTPNFFWTKRVERLYIYLWRLWPLTVVATLKSVLFWLISDTCCT